jgi:hypothetical protein
MHSVVEKREYEQFEYRGSAQPEADYDGQRFLGSLGCYATMQQMRSNGTLISLRPTSLPLPKIINSLSWRVTG